MIDGTEQIADHFISLAESCGVRFSVPGNMADGWLPVGYQLVTDPTHIIQPDDCIMPVLDNAWRLVSTCNGGLRIGRCAENIGSDVIYIATRKA